MSSMNLRSRIIQVGGSLAPVLDFSFIYFSFFFLQPLAPAASSPALSVKVKGNTGRQANTS